MTSNIRKLKKSIQGSIKLTLIDIINDIPKVTNHFYYGAIDISPAYLVIWYFFSTNKDLQDAENTGLVDKIKSNTISHLIDNKYPTSALVDETIALSEKIKMVGGTIEQQKIVTDALTHRKVSIAFSSDEDVQVKANGDYRRYFQ